MKPRTKLEKRVTELSGKLPAITKEQEDWAKEHLFDHFAYKCKDELWCSCGKMWVNTSKDKLGDKIECPYCHHQLDVKVSRKQKIREEAYMSILQVKGGFQVIRHILCWKMFGRKLLRCIMILQKWFKSGFVKTENVRS